jgi:transposase InsO family protein
VDGQGAAGIKPCRCRPILGQGRTKIFTVGIRHSLLWKSVKYERVYLHAYDSVGEARGSILQYLDWYNQSRPHSKLDKKTPNEAYAGMLPPVKMAA